MELRSANRLPGRVCKVPPFHNAAYLVAPAICLLFEPATAAEAFQLTAKHIMNEHSRANKAGAPARLPLSLVEGPAIRKTNKQRKDSLPAACCSLDVGPSFANDNGSQVPSQKPRSVCQVTRLRDVASEQAWEAGSSAWCLSVQSQLPTSCSLYQPVAPAMRTAVHRSCLQSIKAKKHADIR